MKNVICEFIISMLFSVTIYAESMNSFPYETVCIQLEDGAEKEWRVFSRSVNKSKGLVKLVRADQFDEKIMEMISIEYCDVSAMRGVKGFNFDLVLEVYNDKVAKISNVISKKCLERTRNEYLEEIRLKDTDGKIIHEINRCVLTDSTFHRIHYSSKAMTPDMRAKWLNILKETQIVPYQQAYDLKEISLVDKFSHSISLPGYFNHWVELDNWVFENGHTMVEYCPVPEDGSPVGEVLEVTSVCNFSGLTMDKFYDLANKNVSSKAKAKVRFDVMESSPSEMIYKYKYPLEKHTLNVVVRSVLTRQGYFSFSYKLALDKELSSDVVEEIVEKLKAIKIED